MSRRALLLLLLGALALGGLVLVLNPDYRIDRILESNADYYSETARQADPPETRDPR